MPRGSKPGERRGGRKAGTLNQATKEIKAELAQLFTPQYFQALPVRLADGKLAPAIEAKLLAYRYGEPKQHMELTGKDGSPITITHHYTPQPGA